MDANGTAAGEGSGVVTGTGMGADVGARTGTGLGTDRVGPAADPAAPGAAPVSGPRVPTAGRVALVGRTARRVARPSRRLVDRLGSGARDAGMATAEYAIATLAAVGFAGLLVVILRSDEVRGLLLGIVRRALSS